MKIDELLEGKKSLAITGHVRPDGDCVGSTLALYGYVQKNFPDIRADIFLEKPTDKLSFICNFDKINSDYKSDITYDIMICLDSASRERIGKANRFFRTAGLTVNIDHHVSNPGYADINHVEGDSSSACEVLYGLLDPSKLSRDIAISLYTGIIYDTGVFKYQATTPQTMRIAAELMEYDIPTNFIIDNSFYAKTYDENRIFGYALMNSRLAYGGCVIYSSISKREMQEFGATGQDLEGIVAQLRLVLGIRCAIFLSETAPGECKVSLRSNDDVDVNVVAAAFGGGGHVRAAGATLKGTLDECMNALLEEVGKVI